MLKIAMDPVRSCSDHDAVEKRDPMSIWLELKKNGFLSPSHCPMLAKPDKKRERCGNDVLSGKPELAKMPRVESLSKVAASPCGLMKESNSRIKPSLDSMLHTPKKHSEKRRACRPTGALKVVNVRPTDRAFRIAPPSGLLKELNPGIINRIRSSKQVFSVIRDLVGRDVIGNHDVPGRQVDHMERRFRRNYVNECPNSSSGRDQLGMYSKATSELSCVKTEFEEGADDLGIAVKRVDNKNAKNDVKPSQSLSPTSENPSHFVFNKESADTARRSYLPLEDATAASEWLQLLRQDITRRLAALKHSRMRIQNVIKTELPSLMVKGFSLTKKDKQVSTAGCSISTSVDIHQEKWNTLFNQMDKALNEEANLLEVWLYQVIEMQSCNNEGFDVLNWYAGRFPQHLGVSVDTRRF